MRPYQRPLYHDPSRFKITHIGRRWGKSSVSITAGLQGHGPVKGGKPQFVGALDGGDIQWVYPSRGMSSGAWRSIKKVCRDIIVDRSERERRLRLVTGGSITVRSGHDPDALRGPGLNGLIMDEAAFMVEAAWKTVRPSLSDRNGWCIFISSPPVVPNWYSQLFDTVIERGREDWSAWRRPSSDNPQVTEGEIAQLRLDYGDDEAGFDREILGILRPGGVDGWNMGWFAKKWRSPKEWPVFERTCIALDSSWGKDIGADWSAAALWGKEYIGYFAGLDGVLRRKYRYWLLDLWRWKLPYTKLVEEVDLAVVSTDPDYLVVEEASSGFAVVDALRTRYKEQGRRTRVEGVPPKGSKIARVDAVKPTMAESECRVPYQHRYYSDWELEHARFPSLMEGDSDDFVDTSSLALRFLGTPSRVARGRAA